MFTNPYLTTGYPAPSYIPFVHVTSKLILFYVTEADKYSGAFDFLAGRGLCAAGCHTGFVEFVSVPLAIEPHYLPNPLPLTSVWGPTKRTNHSKLPSLLSLSPLRRSNTIDRDKHFIELITRVTLSLSLGAAMLSLHK